MSQPVHEEGKEGPDVPNSRQRPRVGDDLQGIYSALLYLLKLWAQIGMSQASACDFALKPDSELIGFRV